MIELFVALGAGLISFLSPCVLPLIPGYISYISGSSINELEDKKNIILFPTYSFYHWVFNCIYYFWSCLNLFRSNSS